MDDAQVIKKETRGGFRKGAGRPKGIKQPEGAKNAMRVALIKKRLIDHGLGLVKMSPSEVRASEVVLDRHEPRLASIEQTVHDSRDMADPAAVAARLAAMFDAKPELFDQVMSLRAAASTQQTAPQTSEPHVTH